MKMIYGRLTELNAILSQKDKQRNRYILSTRIVYGKIYNDGCQHSTREQEDKLDSLKIAYYIQN